MFVGIPYTSYSLVYPTTASQLDHVTSLISLGSGEIPPFGRRKEKKESEIRFISLLYETLFDFREFFICHETNQNKKISKQQYAVILRDHYNFDMPFYIDLLKIY